MDSTKEAETETVKIGLDEKASQLADKINSTVWTEAFLDGYHAGMSKGIRDCTILFIGVIWGVMLYHLLLTTE